jgi:UDPglucose 6-dehydrogenase
MEIIMSKITIHGTGYVGLIMGLFFAELGNQVICLNHIQKKVDQLQQGISTFYEPHLSDLLTKHLENKSIAFSTDLIAGIEFGEFQFITMGTPSAADDSADLSYVFAAAKNIGTHINHDCIVVNKSTVPVGTTLKIKQIIDDELAARNVKLHVGIAFNPEFLQEGSAIENLMFPDRIIIGSESKYIIEKLYELFKPTIKKEEQFITMNVCSAELSKYAANAFLATKISFVNEIANIAELVGADIIAVKKGIGSDQRISPRFLNAGVGYGGSCFPKDVRALAKTAESVNYHSPLLESIEHVNNHQKHVVFHKLFNYFQEDIKGKIFAMWGLSFKPNTTDLREAPSITIMKDLWEHGAIVKAYDPVAMQDAKEMFGERSDFILCNTKDEALANADALILVTEWDEFLHPDFDFIQKTLKNPIIFDGRNIYNQQQLMDLGFAYFGIGRGICAMPKR